MSEQNTGRYSVGQEIIGINFCYEGRKIAGVLIPYIYSNLDIDNKFQLAVAGVHTKTCQILTEDGRKIVIHGSANLRSSANVEQITIEENEQLYDFYEEFYSKIIDEYSTIRKPIRGNKLWNVVNK